MSESIEERVRKLETTQTGDGAGCVALLTWAVCFVVFFILLDPIVRLHMVDIQQYYAGTLIGNLIGAPQ